MKTLVVSLVLVLLGGVAQAAPDLCSAPDGYQSPFRDAVKDPTGHDTAIPVWKCEVQKDPALREDINADLRHAVERDESATIARNNQSVVMAYIAIWVLTAGFVLVTFLRQGKLKGEIVRLQADLKRALEDSK
jgi:CcmD family protein